MVVSNDRGVSKGEEMTDSAEKVGVVSSKETIRAYERKKEIARDDDV